MDSVSESTLSSESSLDSESDTDAESIQSMELGVTLPDDIATAAAEGDLTVVRRWLEAGWSLTDPTLMEPSGYDEDEDERDVNAWLVARGRATTADPLLGRVAGLPNELRSKVLGYWCLAE